MPLDEADQVDSALTQSDQEVDRVKPWTIKGIPPEERNAAIAAAERNDLTIGEWMVLAIRERIKAERSDRSPVPVQPSLNQADPRSDLADIERSCIKGSPLHPCAAHRVRNNGFNYAMPHPNVMGNPTPVYPAYIYPDGSIRSVPGSVAGVVTGQVTGNRMEGVISGLGCEYAFTAYRQ
jgi:hypothetical protein